MGARRIRRLLVANRGEIARRIIRGAHDAGCEAVGVYAADDAASPYVGEADAAVLLHGTSLGETYLSAAALVQAADLAGADALHPGYGFLSENPSLPEACAAAGIVWVGPPPEAMRVMGHKARAKELAAGAGVPVLASAVVTGAGDGADGAATAVGYPLLVKASAGGGGRGMRLVREPDELAEAVASAQREAAAAFGSDEVFLERYLEAPRHVEVQVIGDTHGTVLHLLDRECSVQRRHQKVVEEAPAVLVPAVIRQQMWDAALAVARAVDYVGAGTVEYLVDDSGFYFLEMNTRLQVEHGVTELVTGLDLVGLQLAVAEGGPLPFAQDEVVGEGHAVEIRLCAERPRDDYRPTPGTATHVRWPEGKGLRTDGGIESGSVVSPAYDSLVAKVMAHGGDRPAAIAQLSPRPSGPRARWPGDQPAAARGGPRRRCLPTGRGGRPLPGGPSRPARCGVARSGAASARRRRRLLPDRRAGPPQPRAAARPRLAQRGPAPARRSVDGRHRDGRGARGRARPTRRVLVDGEWRDVGTASPVGGVVDLVARDGLRRRYRVRLSAHEADVSGPEGQSTFTLRTEDDADTRGGVAGECRAPLPGAVTKVLVAVGDTVAEGDGLVVLEAMKMEHTLRANGAGTVTQITSAPGQQVDVNDLLVVVEPV